MSHAPIYLFYIFLPLLTKMLQRSTIKTWNIMSYRCWQAAIVLKTLPKWQTLFVAWALSDLPGLIGTGQISLTSIGTTQDAWESWLLHRNVPNETTDQLNQCISKTQGICFQREESPSRKLNEDWAFQLNHCFSFFLLSFRGRFQEAPHSESSCARHLGPAGDSGDSGGRNGDRGDREGMEETGSSGYFSNSTSSESDTVAANNKEQFVIICWRLCFVFGYWIFMDFPQHIWDLRMPAIHAFGSPNVFKVWLGCELTWTPGARWSKMQEHHSSTHCRFRMVQRRSQGIVESLQQRTKWHVLKCDHLHNLCNTDDETEIDKLWDYYINTARILYTVYYHPTENFVLWMTLYHRPSFCMRIAVLHQRPAPNFAKLKLKRKLWKNSWTRSLLLTLVSQHLSEAWDLDQQWYAEIDMCQLLRMWRFHKASGSSRMLCQSDISK